MTRTTKGNVVIELSSVLPINVSPLNKAGSFVRLLTLLALCWSAEVSPYPIVQRSVRCVLTFPAVMVYSVVVCFFVVLRSVKSCFCTIRNKLGVSDKRITLPTAKGFFGNVRWRVMFGLLTSEALYCWHSNIVRNYSAISKLSWL